MNVRPKYKPHFEMRHDQTDQRYYWQYRPSNRRIISGREGYPLRSDCISAIRALQETSGKTPITIIQGE